jgi:NAD dependent epimerase/dehydratase family enzyme
MLDNDSLRGPVNIVAPNAVTNRELTKTLGRVLSRPTFMRAPAFAVRLAAGELADEALLASTRAYPKRLLDSGYEFVLPELEKALRTLLAR